MIFINSLIKDLARSIILLGDNMKKKQNFLILLIILVIIGGSGFIKYKNYKNSYQFKLKEKGYNKDEVKIIVDKFDENQVELIIDKEYNDKLISITNHKYFIKDKLNKYITYQENNKDLNIDEIISIVNAGADKDFYTEITKTDTSKGNLMLVNKFYHLEENFKFDDIVPISNQYAYADHSARKKVHDQYISMWHAAKKEGHTLIVTSSYRDYELQDYLYNNYKNVHGEEEADTFSARPGHSEHQTGLALDIVTYGSGLNEDFSKTKEYEWMKKNAHKYGFIIRYPKGKEHITGYMFEPWHYRYVGKDIANKIYELDITFDEYYELYIK